MDETKQPAVKEMTPDELAEFQAHLNGVSNVIRVEGGSLPQNVAHAERALAAATRSDPERGIYQRGGVLVRRCRAAGPENLDDKDVLDPVALVVEQHHEIIGVLGRNAEGLRPRQLGNAECHATILLQLDYGLSYAVRATTLDIG